jgi:hypothetical protein
MKNADDGAMDIRDSALSALGILKGRLGDATMAKYLETLNP